MLAQVYGAGVQAMQATAERHKTQVESARSLAVGAKPGADAGSAARSIPFFTHRRFRERLDFSWRFKLATAAGVAVVIAGGLALFG